MSRQSPSKTCARRCAQNGSRAWAIGTTESHHGPPSGSPLHPYGVSPPSSPPTTVTRTLRLLALAADDDLGRIWRDGYRDVIDLLEHDRRNDGVERYRRIFDDARGRIATMTFAPGERRS